MKDLSLHLMDIAQNATAAGARHVEMVLAVEPEPGTLVLTVTDDGRGMDAEFLAHVTDPFTTTRTTRKVGLGIPLLKMAAELTGGRMAICSTEGVGTTLVATFVLASIDRIPVGDIAGTVAALITAWTEIDWTLRLQSPKEVFTLSTMEMKEVLGDASLGDPAVSGWVEQTVQEAMTEVFGGILDEIIEGFGSHP